MLQATEKERKKEGKKDKRMIQLQTHDYIYNEKKGASGSFRRNGGIDINIRKINQGEKGGSHKYRSKKFNICTHNISVKTFCVRVYMCMRTHTFCYFMHITCNVCINSIMTFCFNSKGDPLLSCDFLTCVASPSQLSICWLPWLPTDQISGTKIIKSISSRPCNIL